MDLRRGRSSRAPAFLANASLALVCAACGQAARPAARTLTIAIRADVTGFFPGPPMVNEAFTIEANRSIFEGLVRFDRDLRVRPGLAESWENPDPTTYRFRLRPGVRFSDGRPVGAGDVVASLEANRESWVTRDYLQAIESVRALGAGEVEIRTRVPYLALLTRLPWGVVIPAEQVRARVSRGIGTGPYRLASWDQGREIVLERNPFYWGPPPDFSRVRFVVEPDGARRVAMVESGQADAADQIPLAELGRLESLPSLQVRVGSGLRVIFLALRVDRAPFSDPRVREAVDLAVDRAELVSRALAGRARPASQLVTRAILGFDPRLTVTLPDPARARALLAAAGFPHGLSVRLDGTNNRYVRDQAILAELARQLARVGIRADVNAMDKREFFKMIEAGRSKIYLLGYSCESGDAGDVLGSLLHSARGGALGSLNTLGLADHELDRLIEAADAAHNASERTRRLQAAIDRVTALHVALPLLVQTEAVLLSRRIEWRPPLNLMFRPEDMHPAPAAASEPR